MRPRLALAAVLSGAALTAGCGLLLDFGHLDDGSGGSGGATSHSASTGSTSATTTSGSTASSGSTSVTTSTSSTAGTTSASSTTSTGSGMTFPPVGIQTSTGNPDGGGLHYKIDATEVTVAEYQAFVTAFSKTPFVQRDVCWWNHSVEPNTSPPNDAGIGTSQQCAAYNLDTEVAAHPNAPVRCVDWCDAATYCEWAGGWMCHGNEGVNTYLPEWETACRGPNNHKFPYGGTFQSGACVDNSSPQPLDVHSKATCEGGYTGVFDMSGNVAEWVDCGCEYDDPDSSKTNAYVGGGGYKETGDALDCTPTRTEAIVSFHIDIGIRCCYPP